jgi:SAM-dependent methyltransferase
MTDNFQNYSKYYDLLYKDKNYEAESAYVTKLLKNVAPHARAVIELGCGSGAHASYLCKEGYELTGIERSQEMVNIAMEKRIENFTPVHGNIEDFSLNRQFDVAISLFHVISYLTDNKALLNCFKLTNKHLNKDGVFLFDVWYTPAVYMQKPETRIRRLADENIDVVRIAESGMDYEHNVVNVNFEVIIKDKLTGKTETIQENHPMRHFSTGEIGFLASQTGFELIKTEEFLTGARPGSDTWGVCFVLKKVRDDE